MQALLTRFSYRAATTSLVSNPLLAPCLNSEVFAGYILGHRLWPLNDGRCLFHQTPSASQATREICRRHR